MSAMWDNTRSSFESLIRQDAALDIAQKAKAYDSVCVMVHLLDWMATNMQNVIFSRNGVTLETRIVHEPKTGHLASCIEIKPLHYRTTISTSIIYECYKQTASIQSICDRSYKPDTIAAMAIMCVLFHESVHIVWGHHDTGDVESKDILADEVSADFRAGVLMLQLFKLETAKKFLAENYSVKTSRDFVECAIMGFACLCTVLLKYYRPSDKYLSPPVRFQTISSGLVHIVDQSKFLDGTYAARIFDEALVITAKMGHSFADPRLLDTVLRGDKVDEKRAVNEVAAVMDKRVPRAMNASRVLKPLRDRRGDFK